MLSAKHLLVCAIVACCSIRVSGEKWRFALKRLTECAPRVELVASWRDLKVTFLQHGDVFRFDCVIEFARDVNVTTIQLELFKDGVVPIKFLTWRNRDACKYIADNDGYFSPIFADGALPRTCYLKQGVYPSTMVFDITGELPGSTFRSSYAFTVSLLERSRPVFCAHGHGQFKKNGN